MHIKHIHETLENLSGYACEEASKSVECINTCELGSVVDMIKDLAEGGVVGMAKNFVPRAKNIATGDSFINHAQASKNILNKEGQNAHNTKKHEG